MAHTACEMIWRKNLMMELNFKQSGTMLMHCYNQSAIYIIENHLFHKRTKQIEVDCHFVRDVWTKKLVAF